LLGESGGRQIAESSSLSDAVVEDLDAFRDFSLGLLADREAAMMNQFSLQGTPAVSLATH